MTTTTNDTVTDSMKLVASELADNRDKDIHAKGKSFYPTIEKTVIKNMDNALKKLDNEVGHIFKDTRYSEIYRAEQFSSAIGRNITKLNEDHAKFSQSLEKDIAKLTKSVAFEPSISNTEASKMMYTRDSLQVAWDAMSYGAMIADWQSAIDNKDTVKSRIYRDFVHKSMRSKLPVNPHTKQRPTEAPGYSPLASATKDLLMTPKQRVHEAKLSYAKNILQKLNMAYNRASGDLKGAKYNHEGVLESGGALEMREIVRSWF